MAGAFSSDETTPDEMKAALLHVIAAVNDIGNGLRVMVRDRGFLSQSHAFGGLLSQDPVQHLDRQLSQAHERLRRAVDLIVKEVPKND